MNYVKLSVRSLLLRWRQYISLFFVCAIGAGVSLFSFFLISGMLHSLSTKAEIYYGGNYQFLGGRSNLEFYDCREFVEKLSDVFPAETVISPRFDFDADSASFYYEGVEVRQRVIKGVDFENSIFKIQLCAGKRRRNCRNKWRSGFRKNCIHAGSFNWRFYNLYA